MGFCIIIKQYLIMRFFPLPLRSPTPVGYLTETNTFLAADAALSALSTTHKDAIDRWFRDLKGESNGSYSTYNVLSKIVTLYPFIGGTSTSMAVNAKSPGTYNLTHTGSPTMNANSISYNGTSQYSRTNFTPNQNYTVISGSDFTGFSVHRTDTNVDTNATCGALGWGNTYCYFQGGASGPGYVVLILSGKTAISESKSYPTNSWYMASWGSSTSMNAYVNGTNVKATTQTYDNIPLHQSYIGAFNINNSSVGYGGANTYDFYMSVKGTWTDAEAASIYNATKALKSALGVTWN